MYTFVIECTVIEVKPHKALCADLNVQCQIMIN